MEQFELFKNRKPPAEKKIKRSRLPDARGYDIIGGYAEKIVGETRKEHMCCICKTTIPAGSRAKEIIQVVNGKLLVRGKEYAHTKGQCPPVAERE